MVGDALYFSTPWAVTGSWERWGGLLLVMIHSAFIPQTLAEHLPCARGYTGDQDTAYSLEGEKYINQIHSELSVSSDKGDYRRV